MTRIRNAALAAVLGLVSISAAHAAIESPIHRNFNVRPGGTIIIDADVGDIKVTAGAANVSVDVIRRAQNVEPIARGRSLQGSRPRLFPGRERRPHPRALQPSHFVVPLEQRPRRPFRRQRPGAVQRRPEDLGRRHHRLRSQRPGTRQDLGRRRFARTDQRRRRCAYLRRRRLHGGIVTPPRRSPLPAATSKSAMPPAR